MNRNIPPYGFGRTRPRDLVGRWEATLGYLQWVRRARKEPSRTFSSGFAGPKGNLLQWLRWTQKRGRERGTRACALACACSVDFCSVRLAERMKVCMHTLGKRAHACTDWAWARARSFARECPGTPWPAIAALHLLEFRAPKTAFFFASRLP